MSDPALPLKRIRLELDQTMRARAFVSRAVRGALTDQEHRDLIVQLRALVRVAGDEELRELADAEIEGDAVAGACVATALFSRVVEGAGLSTGERRSSVLTVLGTSWLLDVTSRRESRFLHALYDSACVALEELKRDLRERDPQPTYALAELARGAVLGVVTYLDETWPPPIYYLRIDSPN